MRPNALTLVRRMASNVSIRAVADRRATNASRGRSLVRLMPSRLGLIDPATRNVIARVDELQDYWNTANAFSPDGKYFTELSGAAVYRIDSAGPAL